MILLARPGSRGPQGQPGLLAATSSRRLSEVQGFQATLGSWRRVQSRNTFFPLFSFIGIFATNPQKEVYLKYLDNLTLYVLDLHDLSETWHSDSESFSERYFKEPTFFL